MITYLVPASYERSSYNSTANIMVIIHIGLMSSKSFQLRMRSSKLKRGLVGSEGWWRKRGEWKEERSRGRVGWDWGKRKEKKKIRPKKEDRENFQIHSMKLALFWYPNLIRTPLNKEYTNILDEHRCKSSQNISKPNPIIH